MSLLSKIRSWFTKQEAVKFDYARTAVPSDYICAKCKKTNCKLWREYQTIAPQLLCGPCACENEKKDAKFNEVSGRRIADGRETDQIGFYVPAVPTEKNESYWGYTSVPEEGVDWWYRLPFLPGLKDGVRPDDTIWWKKYPELKGKL